MTQCVLGASSLKAKQLSAIKWKCFVQEVRNNYDQAETTIQSRGKQTKLRRLATAPYYLVERLVKKAQEFANVSCHKRERVKMSWISSKTHSY